MTENLSQLEFEVKQARAKLATDLAVLRSPQTYRDFAADMKSDTRSFVQRALEDIKARAATNPAAALAIGAGLGWRLIKHPPIATALIGAGLYSLWRTTSAPIDGDGYFSTAQHRLGEQFSNAAETMKDYAAEKALAAHEEAREYAASARDRVQILAGSAADQASETLGRAREAATDVSERAVNVAQRATSQVDRAVADQGVRDQVLLGIAGLAVTAALGIAYQHRPNNRGRSWD